MAVFMTCTWYYEVHRGRVTTQGLRCFLLNELFPAFRAQQLAYGIRWRHRRCRWAEVLLTRVVAPREQGLRFWYLQKGNSWILRLHINFTQDDAKGVI